MHTRRGAVGAGTANNLSDNISVLLGNGDGTFSGPTNFVGAGEVDGVVRRVA
jgi:hypothetical protein